MFCLLFRAPEGLMKGMENPFLVDKGLSLSQVGLVSGGMAATIGLCGSFLAALFIRMQGLGPFIWTLAIARTLVFAGFAAAAAMPVPAFVLIGPAGANTIVRYMEVVALYSFYMGVANPRQAATDFTILSSAQLLIYMIGGMMGGVIADAIGYRDLFTLSAVLSIVILLVCRRIIQPEHPALKTA